MPFEAGILHDLEDYERFLTWRAGAVAREGALCAAVQRDLVLLHAETLKVAAFAAAATSLAMHACGAAGGRSQAYPGCIFAADFSAAAEQRMFELPRTPELFDVHQAWLEVQARLSFANVMTRARSAAGAAEIISPDLLADAWVRGCHALLVWQQRLSAVLAVNGAGGQARGEAEAVRLLRRAAAGESVCIDAEGMLTLPGWAERRREERRTITLEATVLAGTKYFRSRLQDISRRGLRLATDVGIPGGTPVSVALPEGRTLKGHVRWSADGGIGVELEEPLSNDDPLWQAASPAAGH